MEPVGGRSTATSSSSMTERAPLSARRAGPLKGRVRVPGDKSISHRALILGALAVGKCNISGLLEGDDVLNTAKAVVALGAAAGCPITAIFDGDASLRRRPMRRVLEPLQRIGARANSAEDGRLPVTLTGADDPIPIVFEPPVPSAQLKSAVLLAGLSAPGQTVVVEREATRDHTEKMLAYFGAAVRVEPNGDCGRRRPVFGCVPSCRGNNYCRFGHHARWGDDEPVTDRTTHHARRDGGVDRAN